MKRIKFTFLLALLTCMGYAQTNRSCAAATSLRLDVLHTQNMHSLSEWYTFTATGDNHYVSLSSADTTDHIDSIIVYDGSCGRLNLLGAYVIPNNAGNGGTVAIGALNPSAGYYVQVFGTSTGFNYSLNLFKTTASASCISPPPPCEHVCNGGFEDYTSLPIIWSEINKASPWGIPPQGSGSSDYYHISSPPFWLPWLPTLTPTYMGNGMAGIYLQFNSSNGNIVREYIQQKLHKPLEAGSNYYAEMYVHHGDTYAEYDHVGMALTSNQPNVQSQLITSPAGDIVSNPPNNIITQQMGWTKVSGFVQPTSDRNYITIGNFTTDQTQVRAYYLIDEVSVVKIPEAGGTAHGCTLAQLGDSDCPGVAGMTYSWTGPGTFTPNANVLNPTVTQAGTYTLTVTYQGQSFTSSVSVTLGSCQAPFSEVFINETATDLINFYGSTPIANKDISLSGITTIDQDLSLNGSHLFMGCDAKIVITSGNTLTLTNTSATSCDNKNMWEGIIIESGGKLVMDNSTIEDAKVGVSSEAGAEFDVSNSFFNNNIIGIDVLAYNGNHPATLDGTSFNINSALLQPYTNERTYGLRITDVSNFNGATSYNSFSNLHTGIGCYRSDLTIQSNNTFDKLEMGIDARDIIDPNAISYVYVYGPNNEFKNSYSGIIAWYNVSLVVRTARFDNMTAGISSRYNQGDQTLTVSASTFNKVEYGIISFYNFDQNVAIEQNTFTQGSGNANAIFIQNVNTAVSDDGWTPNPPANGNPNNSVLISKNTVDDYYYGIRIRNIFEPSLINNTITSLPSNMWKNSYGINLHNCHNAKVSGNIVTGTNRDIFSGHGIRLDFCAHSDIRCNEVEDLGRGIWCGGQMPFTKVATNMMRNCRTGFWLNYGYIGNQVDAYYDYSATAPVAIPIPSDNAWDGTFENHLYSYESQGHQSPFRIRSSGSPHYNALFDPSSLVSGVYGTTATPITTYSNPGNNGELYSNESFCIHLSFKSAGETDVELLEMEDLAVMAEEHNLSVYVPDETEQQWLLQQALYYQTLEAPELVQNSAELQAFLLDVEQTSIDEIENIEELIQAFEEDGTLASLNLALTVNQAMHTDNNVERQYQDFYDIYITALLEGDGSFDFSQQQLDDLRDMAQRCPYIYGTTVYQARSLLDLVEEPRVEYEHACETAINSNYYKTNPDLKEVEEEMEVQLWPNPASELLFIHIEHPSVANTDWEIRVFDITGAEITRYEKMNASHQWTIPVEKWKNGIYTLQLWQSGKMITSRKLAIIH